MQLCGTVTMRHDYPKVLQIDQRQGLHVLHRNGVTVSHSDTVAGAASLQLHRLKISPFLRVGDTTVACLHLQRVTPAITWHMLICFSSLLCVLGCHMSCIFAARLVGTTATCIAADCGVLHGQTVNSSAKLGVGLYTRLSPSP